MKNAVTAIILVNYNSSAFTLDCIQSIAEKTKESYLICILDNASADKEINLLTAGLNLQGLSVEKDTLLKKGNLLLYLNTQNGGFAAANNKAIEIVLEEFPDTCYFLILNNDTLLTEDIIAKFKSFAGTCKQQPFLTCKTYTPEGEIWYNGGWVSQLKSTAYHQYTESPDEKVIAETGFITGCCLFFHASLLEAFERRLYDESYFMYAEDVDFSIQAALKGIQLIILRNCSFIHRVYGSSGGKHTGSSAFAQYYMNRNRFIIAKKYLTWYKVPVFFTYFLFSRLVLSVKKKDFNYLRGLKDGIKYYFTS